MAGTAVAAEKLGIQEYPGAKPEQESANVIKQMFPRARAYCYSTNDTLDSIVSFYKKQGLNYVGGDKENAMFKKGKVDVTVQSPWMDMKTGKINKSTLISFVENAD
jgi:hypothetical protein